MSTQSSSDAGLESLGVHGLFLREVEEFLLLELPVQMSEYFKQSIVKAIKTSPD